MGSEANAECMATAGKAASLLTRHTSKKMGWGNMAGLLRELLWSQSYLWNVLCLLKQGNSLSSHELLGTSSQSSNWEWWLLKNALLKLHLKLATLSCQFLANCALGRTMGKNPLRICEYNLLGETMSHLLPSSANVNALALNSNSHQSHFPQTVAFFALVNIESGHFLRGS